MTDTNGTSPAGTPVPPEENGHATHDASSPAGHSTQAFSSTQPMAAHQTQSGGSAQPGQPAHQAYQAQPSQPAYQAYQTQPAHQAQPAYQAYQAQLYAQPSQPPAGAPAGGASGKKGGGRTFLIAFAGALLACALAFGGLGLYNAAAGGNAGSSSDSGTSIVLGSQNGSSVNASDTDQTLAEAVAEKCLPSVAAIDVYVSQSSLYGYSYGYGSSSGSGDQLTQYSLGSGVVLTADGYIVTNYHVVEGAEALKVTIAGDQYDAEVVGSDPSSDIAVIKAQDASGLTAMEIGSSDDLTIGEWVMTIGSPFGLEQSVATGIVSATSRSQIMDSSSSQYGSSSGETTIYPNMIQTDAAINPGNSGGALVDADGRLIGINTLITSYSGNYSGVGFAIPVNYAVNIAQQIIDGKTPTHAQLGVTLSTVNAQNAQRYGLAVNAGAYIASVTDGSGAAAAGLEVGDIVTAFDGQAVESASDLMLDIRSKNPGDTVKVTFNRNGETKDVEVTLGSDGTQSSSTQQGSSKSSGSGSSLLDRLFGNGSSSGSQGNAA